MTNEIDPVLICLVKAERPLTLVMVGERLRERRQERPLMEVLGVLIRMEEQGYVRRSPGKHVRYAATKAARRLIFGGWLP